MRPFQNLNYETCFPLLWYCFQCVQSLVIDLLLVSKYFIVALRNLYPDTIFFENQIVSKLIYSIFQTKHIAFLSYGPRLFKVILILENTFLTFKLTIKLPLVPGPLVGNYNVKNFIRLDI